MKNSKQISENLLNQLINIYERRFLKNPSGLNRKVTIKIDKKTVPEYFDESSQIFNDINFSLKHFEEKNFISIVWKNNIKDHIIEKINLNLDNVDSVYKYLNRIPYYLKIEKLNQLIESLLIQYKSSELVNSFLKIIQSKIEANLSIKSIIDPDHPEKLKTLCQILSSIELNNEELFLREFSVKNFENSKFFEKNLSKVISIIKMVREDLIEHNDQQILEEFGILTTPRYLRIKGTGIFQLGSPDNIIDLESLTQGLAVASSDIDKLKLIDSGKIESVITVENLTPYFRISKKNSLIIYTGGFHNSIHREFIKSISKIIPNNRFYHFGDIDVGGFLILFDLIKKTGIHFKPYLMGLDTIEKYNEYSSSLTDNDKKRFNNLITSIKDGSYSEILTITEQKYFLSLFSSLLQTNRKLEHEALYLSI